MIEEGDWPNWTVMTDNFWPLWSKEFVRSFSIISLKRVLEFCVIQSYGAEFADRFMVNLPKLAKAEHESSSRFTVALNMIGYALVANLIASVSTLTVNSIVIIMENRSVEASEEEQSSVMQRKR